MSRVRINGMIDPHVHLRGMAWSHKATFASETRAAIAGGYWAVLDMPNTMPSTVDRPSLNQKLTEIMNEAYCDWGVYFGASADDNSATFADVAKDVIGLKIYNNATTGNLLIDDQSVREQVYATWPAERVIAVHAEEETVLDILALVRKHRKHTHFVHINTAREIQYLRDAKADGLPISIGVTPHHLYLSQADLPQLGPFGLMKPELKTRADVEALWQAIADGVVDVIESDHAPHTRHEKMSDAPPFGVPGLETTASLLFTAVKEGRIDLETLIPMLSTNTHQIFGLRVPAATYTIIDTDASYMIDARMLHGNCDWTPFNGMRVFGQVREVWIRGTQVFDGESIVVNAGFGQQLA